ncbi:MAG: hypothetical protein WD737_13035 [Gemmatimonadota bacterium]
MRALRALLPAVIATGLLHLPLYAQTTRPGVPLEDFVQEVARLWGDGDVGSLVGLLPAEDPLLLDAGSGIESANPRHAAAALRALFAAHETMGATAVRVTVSSTSPARGFGELAWIYRARGAPGEQSRSVYVAVLQEQGGWRITELRVMP